jgi:hypothetical protein
VVNVQNCSYELEWAAIWAKMRIATSEYTLKEGAWASRTRVLASDMYAKGQRLILDSNVKVLK